MLWRIIRKLFPRIDHVELLGAAVGSGFADSAIPLLIQEAKGRGLPAAAAHWFLSKWYFEQGDDARCLDHLSRSGAYTGAPKNARALIRLASTAELDPAWAAKELEDLGRIHPTTDSAFMWRKIPNVSEDRALGEINRLYANHGFAVLQRASTDAPLSIDNLTSVAPQQPSNSKVSVLMPAFNCEATIETSIGSILNQTTTNLELIIVDDNSQDATWRLICEAAETDSRVIPVRHERNRGAYAARNTALSRATGEYVTVNDSDDWAHPQKLATQIKGIEEQGQPYNFSQAVRVTDRLLPSFEGSRTSALSQNLSSLMFKREDILALGGWPEMRVAGDDELSQRLHKWAGKKKYIVGRQVPLTLVRVAGTSLTRKGPTSKISFRFGARKEAQLSYTYWHRSLSGGSTTAKIDPQNLPFPLPNICRPDHGSDLHYDVVYVVDLGDASITEELLAAWQEGARHATSQAVYHWPSLENLTADRSEAVSESISRRLVDIVVSGETIFAKEVRIYSPDSLKFAPDIPIRLISDSIKFSRPPTLDQKLYAESMFISHGANGNISMVAR